MTQIRLRASSIAFLSLVAALSVPAAAQKLWIGQQPFDPLTEAPVGVAVPRLAEGTAQANSHWIVQLNRPPFNADRDLLEQMGAEIVCYVPDNAFLIRANPSQTQQLRKLKIVRWMGPLEAGFRVRPNSQVTGSSEWLVTLFPGEAVDEVLEEALRRGLLILEKSPGRQKRLRVSGSYDQVLFLAQVPSVEFVEPWKQPSLVNNIVRGIIEAHPLENNLGLFGQGQIVGIADSGLDTGDEGTLSPDFAGRLLHVIASRRPGLWSDEVGHGTHVAGSLLGAGVLSGADPANHIYDGSYAGIAPEAEFIFGSYGDNSILLYPPLNLEELFDPCYSLGAKIHSNSWGTASFGAYTDYSEQVDRYAWLHKDFIMLFAAGNDGEDSNNDGVTDSGSLNAPATAKNAIAVGASESLRLTGGIQSTWHARFGGFNANPIRDDLISNNIMGMAAWSSRGPADDGRLKPDIVAPGVNIVSARSHDPSAGYGWEAIGDHYAYWGGTSMSTPLAAGAATIVRQYFTDIKGIAPSSALVKAALLNGALDMNPGQYGTGSGREMTARPNNVEGWGLVNLKNAVEPDAPAIMDYLDDAQGVNTNETQTHIWDVTNEAVPLRITLVWTDYPGSRLVTKQLVNDLNLTVTDSLNNIYLGNGQPDDLNNVETVDIPSPAPGPYQITVRGQNVPFGPQPYAIAVSGGLPGGYVAGAILSSQGNPVSGVTMNITGDKTLSTLTSASGDYSARLGPGEYTLTPTKSGWSFDPPSIDVTVELSGVEDKDFTGTGTPGQLTGTIRKTHGGQVPYVLESAHPYPTNYDRTWIIEGPPDVSTMRLHFQYIITADEGDVVTVLDSADNEIASYFGELEDIWTPAVSAGGGVAGNIIKVRLLTNEAGTSEGFYIDGYETDAVDDGPLAGAAVTLTPGGQSALTGPDGSYEFPGIDPVTYQITPSLGSWKFSPTASTASVPAGGSTSRNFAALAPGSITGTVRTGGLTQVEQTTQSAHPYAPDANITQLIEGSPGASRIRAHFDRFELEGGFDFVFISDGADNIIDVYTGYMPEFWTPWVDGNVLKITLVSDLSNEEWGYSSDRFEEQVTGAGVPGIKILVSPGGTSAYTGHDGSYAVSGVPAGSYQVAPDTPGYASNPESLSVSVIPGLPDPVADFFVTAPAAVTIGQAKGLPDGTAITLADKTVTAGMGQLSGEFYVQEADLSSGIRCSYTGDLPSEGDLVGLTGVMRLQGKERYIEVQMLDTTGTVTPLEPVYVRGVRFGGSDLNSYTPGPGLKGLNNVGMLVRITGSVTHSSESEFRVDDYSGYLDGTSLSGIRVLSGYGDNPAVGSYVTVVGVVGTADSGGIETAVLKRRAPGDLVVH